MKVSLLYGQSGLEVDLEGVNATTLKPAFVKGISDQMAAFQAAVRSPIECLPLKELVGAKDRVVVVIADITRPLPSDLLLPWLFRELKHVPKDRFTIIIGTGSHRGNTPAEIEQMVGKDIAANYRIINHDGHNHDTMAYAGESPFGYPVYFNREYVEADRRIILGFIEPHFMAGFSGGYKAVFPGVTNVEAIMKDHGAKNIGHPRSAWGILEDNPTQENVRAGASLLPIDFCINVALNDKKEITRFFCGETLAAHREGCKFVRETAMVACPNPFPIVITTNGGYPLDQNLYQAVKGMSAAAQILKPGGLILAAARCNDGFPEHGNFKSFLFHYPTAQAMLDKIFEPGFEMFDQWEVQMLANIMVKGRIGLYSKISDQDTLKAKLIPIHDLKKSLHDELAKIGGDSPVAVLPEGPQTIPYLQ